MSAQRACATLGRDKTLQVLEREYTRVSRNDKRLSDKSRERWIQLLTPPHVITAPEICDEVIPEMSRQIPGWDTPTLKPAMAKKYVLDTLFEHCFSSHQLAMLTQIIIKTVWTRVARNHERRPDRKLELDFEKRVFVLGSYLDVTACDSRTPGVETQITARILAVRWAPHNTILPLDSKSIRDRTPEREARINAHSRGISWFLQEPEEPTAIQNRYDLESEVIRGMAPGLMITNHWTSIVPNIRMEYMYIRCSFGFRPHCKRPLIS